MKSYKNYLLLSIVLISQIHVAFAGGKMVDWFLFIDKFRSLEFTIFMTGVFIRFIILHYCLIFPYGINKNIKIYLFILSLFDLLHFILFSGVGYEIEKIFASYIFFCLVKFIRYVKFNYSIL